QPRHDRLERGGRSRLDDRGFLGIEQGGGGGTFAPAVERVDRRDPPSDLEHHRLHLASVRGCRRAVLRSDAKGGVGWGRSTSWYSRAPWPPIRSKARGRPATRSPSSGSPFRKRASASSLCPARSGTRTGANPSSSRSPR